MAVPVIIKVLTHVATDKRVRKVVIAIILAIIMIIPLIIILLISLLSGFASLLEGLSTLDNWNILKTNIEDVGKIYALEDYKMQDFHKAEYYLTLAAKENNQFAQYKYKQKM